MKMTQTIAKYLKYDDNKLAGTKSTDTNKFWKLTQNKPVMTRQNLILEPKEKYIQMTSNLIYFMIRTPINKMWILSWFQVDLIYGHETTPLKHEFRT
jgi:hypothetical protein